VRSPSAVVLCAVLLALLAAACVLALQTGASGALLLPGLADWSAGRDSAAAVILREIRAPRVLTAVSVGAMLGLAGAALQGMLRNPLAEPGLVGASNCAALGAVLVLYFGLSALHPLLLPAAGIAGATASLVWLRAVVGAHTRVATLILAGVAVNAFAGAAIALALNLAPSPYAMHEIVYWLMGAVANRTWAELGFAVPFMLLGAALVVSSARYLDALSLGEDTALTLGFGERSRPWRVFGGVAVGVGAAVAVSGSIGFVGLVVPHLLRPFVANRPGRLLVPSALGGALLVVAADVLVQRLPGGEELKLGVVTSLLGAPFFLALVLSARSRLA
jgi:iron complex transport system permease protein